MPPLPVISGDECIAALERLGYTRTRQKGSHVRLTCEGRSPVTVPLHKELDRGTLRSVLRTVDIPVKDFLALMSE